MPFQVFLSIDQLSLYIIVTVFLLICLFKYSISSTEKIHSSIINTQIVRFSISIVTKVKILVFK